MQSGAVYSLTANQSPGEDDSGTAGDGASGILPDAHLVQKMNPYAHMRSMREFINKVIIAAIAIFAAIFWLNSQGHGSLVDDFLAETFPGISAPSVQIENPINVDLGEVAGALEEINVAGLREADYDREGQFGPAWKDIDGNGCDTRNDILARDLTDITLDKDDCTVLTGTLVDPYTGETIDFQR